MNATMREELHRVLLEIRERYPHATVFIAAAMAHHEQAAKKRTKRTVTARLAGPGGKARAGSVFGVELVKVRAAEE